MASEALKRLKFSTKEIERVTTLIHYHDGVIEETEKAVKRRIHQLGSVGFFDLLALQRADHAAQTEDPDHRKSHTDRLFQIGMDVISTSECVSANQLAVNGHDMIAIGLAGQEIGKMLKLLLYAVMDGEVKNHKEALLSYAKQHNLPS
jgi:tRNA nucleotidyltransferase (CCA-adding enzyme)